MSHWIAIIIGIPIAFVPKRYRFWWHQEEDTEEFRRAAQISGIIQFLAAMLGYIFRFIDFMQQGTKTNAVLLNQGKAMSIPTAGVGMLNIMEFALQPVNLFILYMVIEGTIRTVAATVSEEKLGTLPLYLIAAIHGWKDRVAYRRYIGPLVPDEVIRARTDRQDYDLKIYSCRPKLDWNDYRTVEFEDEFYVLFREEYGGPPRRFVYYLKKSPPNRAVTVIEHYKVDDVLKG